MSVGTRNPFIDTLRGVSIVLVLLHHFNIAYSLRDTALAALVGWNALHAIVRNGNEAVTMFFTISGFLITANTQARYGALSDVGIIAFYRNRFARIVPSLLLVLLVVNVLAACGIGIFRNHPEFGGPVPLWVVDLASLTFWMNVLMSHAGWLNYALCVQWSLSIEEVFYLAFPILCLALRRERLLIAAWSVFIVIGPVWRATHQATQYDELNAYLSCFDGIAFGCCAAVLARHLRLPRGVDTPVRLAAGLALAWLYLSASIADAAVYAVSGIALATAILLLARPRPPRLPWRVLAPLRRCGRLSYELYLFHIVVLGALRTVWSPRTVTGNEKLAILAAYLILSVVVALLVSRLYGEPLNRRLQARRSRASLPDTSR